MELAACAPSIDICLVINLEMEPKDIVRTQH